MGPCSFLFSNVRFFWGTHPGPCPDITRWTALHYCSLSTLDRLTVPSRSSPPPNLANVCPHAGWMLDGEAEACTPRQACPTHTSQHHREGVAADQMRGRLCAVSSTCVNGLVDACVLPRYGTRGWTKGSVPGLNRLRSPIRLANYRTRVSQIIPKVPEQDTISMKPQRASYPLPTTRKGDCYPPIPCHPVPSKTHRLHLEPGSCLWWRVGREYLDDAHAA